jgi:hypothetical protein
MSISIQLDILYPKHNSEAGRRRQSCFLVLYQVCERSAPDFLWKRCAYVIITAGPKLLRVTLAGGSQNSMVHSITYGIDTAD